MPSGRYDPQLAERSVRELAAVTDAELGSSWSWSSWVVGEQFGDPVHPVSGPASRGLALAAGGAGVGVAEQVLDVAQLGAGVQRGGGHGVAQRVRGQLRLPRKPAGLVGA
jgi:hypothetical protein